MAIYDLQAFRHRLPPSHARLAKALRQWIDAHSISTDLALCGEYVDDALRLHRTGRSSLDNACTALIHAAVIGYARSLERRSDHRGFLKVIGRMSIDAQVMHGRLIEVRDEALAHFGPAGGSRGWAEDHAVLMVDGTMMQLAVGSRRDLFDHSFAERFKLHLSEVLPIVQRIVGDRRCAFQADFAGYAGDKVVTEALHASETEQAAYGELGKMFRLQATAGRTIKVLIDQ